MPNWCHNLVKIEGPREILSLFSTALDHQLAEDKQVFFSNNVYNSDKGTFEPHANYSETEENYSPLRTFIPIPSFFLSDEGFDKFGYDWCCKKWGTKWKEKDMSMSIAESEIEFSFSSPWGPPLIGYLAISELFPELMFVHYYEDHTADYIGISKFKNGDVIYSEEIDGSSFQIEDNPERTCDLITETRDNMEARAFVANKV